MSELARKNSDDLLDNSREDKALLRMNQFQMENNKAKISEQIAKNSREYAICFYRICKSRYKITYTQFKELTKEEIMALDSIVSRDTASMVKSGFCMAVLLFLGILPGLLYWYCNDHFGYRNARENLIKLLEDDFIPFNLFLNSVSEGDLDW